MSDVPTPSEALFGFAAWLTTRKEPLTLGANHDAAPVAQLVADFCDSQSFAMPRENYADKLKDYPSEPLNKKKRPVVRSREIFVLLPSAVDGYDKPRKAYDTQQIADNQATKAAKHIDHGKGVEVVRVPFVYKDG